MTLHSFEYGEELARDIVAFDPTFWKVLVRYNPNGEVNLNRRQAQRLRRPSDYLHGRNRLSIFERLVPPEAAQREWLHIDGRFQEWTQLSEWARVA